MISTKWPGLFASGEKVPKELASEILFRTSRWPLCTNDHLADFQVAFWLDLITEEAKERYEKTGEFESFIYSALSYEKLGSFREKYKILDLEYLGNSQIASSWIGGPHGWMDFEGNVGCSNYNVGKWPSLEELLEEAKVIAEAFPTLKVTFKFLGCEWCETDSAEYIFTDQLVVSKGSVEHKEISEAPPAHTGCDVSPDDFVRQLMYSGPLGRGTEYSVSPAQVLYMAREVDKTQPTVVEF